MSTASAQTPPALSPATFRGDLGGSLGDLGTLLPFLVGYIVVAGVQASAILLAFGISLLAVGWRYGIPFPVQPMKAVGAAALAHTATAAHSMPEVLALTAAMTAAFWLVAGWTGVARWLAAHLSRDVVHGVVLGLGIALILGSLRRIEGDWVVGLTSVLAALVLLGRGAWLLMPLLLLAGFAVGTWRQPELMAAALQTPAAVALPQPVWNGIPATSVWLSAAALTLAQTPLTFGNAILGIVSETKRLFPATRIDENRVARSTGWMNLLAAGLSAPPMCHGAGGLVAQAALGARTGRAPMWLGGALVLLALFASAPVAALLALLPQGTLGAMLFVAGFSLVIGTAGNPRDKQARAVLLTTAAISVWNAGVGVLAGLLLEKGLQTRVFKL
ncbi:molybdate transporter family protein [Hydrogenophaga laconesensis]|uniref:MFS superfamily sulfate permease-like transporter n=1 Tax=Hydrogenophaga laconesensis TaxID=1805971 RepID=A0ABU1V563_9BURK|nr:molybdate transporter family protein [Hydrogenophaga laconesensis]MDR7092598.1 MFS superfamily sulfate permease-like transporter [Hydrogenophaga laconesensis]